MTLDEYEALRLADLNGLYQEEAAEQMGVSRQTFGRIVDSAHRKVAEALVNAQGLEIKGGEIEMVNQREFQCSDCKRSWQVPYGTGRPAACPQCHSKNIHRSPQDSGWGHRDTGGPGPSPGRGMHRGRCCRRGGPEANRQGGKQ